MLFTKVHKSYRSVVAICDKELLGKIFEEGKKQLEVSENFFKGEEMSAEEAVKLMHDQAREDASFNIVGNEAIDAAQKAGIADKDSVGNVQGIPIILVF